MKNYKHVNRTVRKAKAPTHTHTHTQAKIRNTQHSKPKKANDQQSDTNSNVS